MTNEIKIIDLFIFNKIIIRYCFLTIFCHKGTKLQKEFIMAQAFVNLCALVSWWQ